MTFKAILSLFLLVTTLATIIYAKPSPIWIPNLDQASTKDMIMIESDKEVANSQTAEKPLRELSRESNILLISNQSECPWPPALCPDGGMHGKPIH